MGGGGDIMLPIPFIFESEEGGGGTITYTQDEEVEEGNVTVFHLGRMGQAPMGGGDGEGEGFIEFIVCLSIHYCKIKKKVLKIKKLSPLPTRL